MRGQAEGQKEGGERDTQCRCVSCIPGVFLSLGSQLCVRLLGLAEVCVLPSGRVCEVVCGGELPPSSLPPLLSIYPAPNPVIGAVGKHAHHPPTRCTHTRLSACPQAGDRFTPIVADTPDVLTLPGHFTSLLVCSFIHSFICSSGSTNNPVRPVLLLSLFYM